MQTDLKSRAPKDRRTVSHRLVLTHVRRVCCAMSVSRPRHPFLEAVCLDFRRFVRVSVYGRSLRSGGRLAFHEYEFVKAILAAPSMASLSFRTTIARMSCCWVCPEEPAQGVLMQQDEEGLLRVVAGAGPDSTHGAAPREAPRPTLGSHIRRPASISHPSRRLDGAPSPCGCSSAASVNHSRFGRSSVNFGLQDHNGPAFQAYGSAPVAASSSAKGWFWREIKTQ
jgi:hypothetical protein